MATGLLARGFHPTEGGRSVELKRPSDETLPRGLLIAAAFPPSSAVGALRWEKFAAYLHDAGIALDVITMHPDETESPDPSRLEGLPTSTRVTAVRSLPSRMLRLLLYAYRRRGMAKSRQAASSPPGPVNASRSVGSTAVLVRTAALRPVPVTREELARWYKGRLDRAFENAFARAALLVARKELAEHNHEFVVSSGPPNLLHVSAARGAAASGVPFVMDMRDPWGTAVALPREVASGLELRHARRMERFCVRHASAIVVNTPLARELFIKAHPDASTKCYVVMNGTDDDLVAPAPSNRNRFVIAFAGSIYLDRNPRLVFRAAAQVIAELGLTPEQFGFEFIGSVFEYGGASTAAIAADEGITQYVHLSPFVPRKQLLERLANASMLLSLPQDIETSIPAKIFEYMSYPAWLLVLATGDSATAKLLETTTADVVDPNNVDGIRDRIRSRYLEFAAGVTPIPVGADGSFSRRRQAQRLLSVIDSHRRPMPHANVSAPAR